MSTGIKILTFGLLCLIWSSTWMMIKIGLQDAPPMMSAALRFLVASPIILVILIARKTRLPRTRSFIFLSLFLGVAQMGLSYGLVYWSEQYLPSGLTAVLFSTMPLMVAVLARFVLNDPFSMRKILGIALGVAGVYTIFSDRLEIGGQASVLGVFAALGAAFLASVSSVTIKRHSSNYDPFASMLIPKFVGGVILLAGSLIFERGSSIQFTPRVIGTVLYLAVFGSVVAFALFFWIIKHLDVTVLSYQTFIIPMLALLLGWIFLGETVTIDVALGGGMIVVGIVLAVFKRPPSKAIHVEPR